MDAASHTGFIVAAYAVGFGVMGGLLAWVLADYRAQLRKLAELEKRGVLRRATTPAQRPARQAEKNA